MMRRNNSVSSFDVCGELDMGNVLSVIVFRRIEILLYFISTESHRIHVLIARLIFSQLHLISTLNTTSELSIVFSK